MNHGDTYVLQLHLQLWEAGHNHSPLGDPNVTPGNGLVLWFELDDFDAAYERAKKLEVEILMDRHWSENGNWQFWLRDPNGYTVVLTNPLPNP